MPSKDWVRDWLDLAIDNEWVEVEIESDVFYDFLMSMPNVEFQLKYREYKAKFLEKVKNGSKEEFAKDMGSAEDSPEAAEELQKLFEKWQEDLENLESWQREIQKIKEEGIKALGSATIFPSIYIPRNGVGRYSRFSYHFFSMSECYIRCAAALDGLLLDDGSRLPSTKPFTEASYDPVTRTFRGKIDWSPTSFNGFQKQEFELVFSDDFDTISAGKQINFIPMPSQSEAFKQDELPPGWEAGQDGSPGKALRYPDDLTYTIGKSEELEQKAEDIDSKMTLGIKSHLRKQAPVAGTIDTICIKMMWFILVNLAVYALIYLIMNTISSSGLPGRQRLPESSSFSVILKVDPTVATNKDRFDRPQTITDVCQGLGWWMEDPMFKLDPYTMPTGDALRNLTKQHWDPKLNEDYECPAVLKGLENKLMNAANQNGCSNGVSPESSTWRGDDETTEFFLFQDQNTFLTVLSRKDVYHENGLTVTHKATNVKKQFSVMAGNYNGKVQHLQPIEPLDVKYDPTTKPSTLYYNPFWVAQDRIWPSEWAVQALFTLDWNSNKAWKPSVLVGGFNDFGRRPTAIVEANVGGSIGPVDRNGYMIENAIWQFLERRCWRTTIITVPYSPKNQYDLKARPRITWDDLDQGLRDYWRALGLGLDTSRCPFVNLRVSTGNKCIGQGAESTCQRVNYHSVQRWNAYNDEAIAATNFNTRNFTNIFFEHQCDSEKVVGNARVKTPINGAPTRVPLTWDKLELAENGKLLEAATALGYDQEEWDRHAADPLSLPPDNLVLAMENYLEGEAYFSTYFWTQIICSTVMVAVNILEMRRIFDAFTIMGLIKDDFALSLLVSLTILVQYFFIPLLLGMVSLLLLLESGSVVDVIKDTLSLLFLNEINNYLQVRNTPEARKWKIFLKQGAINVSTRLKSIFTTVLFIGFAIVIWIASEKVYTGGGSVSYRVHPSILFNILRQSPGARNEGIDFFMAFYAAYVSSLILSLFVLLCLKKFEKDSKHFRVEDPAGGISEPKTYGSRVSGWYFRNIHVPLQGFVGAVFYRQFDIDHAKPQDDIDDGQSSQWARPTDADNQSRGLPLPPPQPATTMQYLNGRMMQVPMQENIGEVMATRLPGASASIVISRPPMPTSVPSPMFQPP